MDPTALLPHRPPFLFLDAVDEVTGARGAGRYRFRGDEFFFAGHFPGDPIVPAVIQLEVMAQLAAIGASRELGGGRVVLGKLDACKFHRILRPGDEVVATAERRWGRSGAVAAAAELRLRSSGELVSEALILGVGRGE